MAYTRLEMAYVRFDSYGLIHGLGFCSIRNPFFHFAT